jgi:predicted GTPase
MASWEASMTDVTKVIIMGAAGRDFHNFNVVFRRNPHYRVVAFTAAQIPNIAGRRYPPALAGRLYPSGIPIHPEAELEALIHDYDVDEVVFAYSDVSHDEVMHRASRVMARGADFRLLGPDSTMLRTKKPVVSICAVRTGCGKSPVARRVAAIVRERGLRVVVVRHPMPYGDLATQAVQRFESFDDLTKADCTIEEREEYEPHLEQGTVVFAGVDYERILPRAEDEADVIVWDGGNNDVPFFVPELEIVLMDPHRAGHERRYFPGEINALRAHIVVLTKLDTAEAAQVDAMRRSIRDLNPRAAVVETAMPPTIIPPGALKGKRVLVVEDGPTLSHGGMAYGAGTVAARQAGAAELVDPRPYAVGSLRDAFAAYPHIGPALPAMGYGSRQLHDLEETIRHVPCDMVAVATPIDLARQVAIRQPTCRVRYDVQEIGEVTLRQAMSGFLEKALSHA